MLHYAAEASKLKLIRLLIDSKADVNIRDNNGRIAVDLCTTDKARKSFIPPDEFSRASEPSLDMAIQGTKIESPIKKIKEEPKTEIAKHSNKDTLFNMLKMAQNYGVHLGAHVNNPHMYNGSWMEGVKNVAELTEVLANYDQTTTAMMIFNLLFPFEGKLPAATNDDNSIPELFGFKKIAAEPRVDYKKEAETVKKELEIANQNISKMTISIAQLEGVNTSLNKDNEQKIQSLERELASLKKTVTQLQNKPKVMTTDYSLQASVAINSMDIQASPLVAEVECQCEVVETHVEKEESMSMRSIPNEDSVQIYEIQMIQVLRGIMRIFDRNLVEFSEGNYIEQLAKMLGSVGTENAQDIAELLFPQNTVCSPAQALSCTEMIYEDACSYINSLLREAEFVNKLAFFDYFRSKNMYQVTLKIMEEHYPSMLPKKLEDLFNLVNFNGDEFITIENVENTKMDEMKYCISFWLNDIVVVNSHTYILSINDIKSNQLQTNKQWNDTIAFSSQVMQIQLCEQSGSDYIAISTLKFPIDTTQLNQTIEIGNIQFNTVDHTTLASAYFKYSLLPIEDLHKQMPADENHIISPTQIEENKLDQADPLGEGNQNDAKEPINIINENQLNENESDIKNNSIPALPIAKEKTIDEVIISSNIDIEDEKTNVITHSSRDKFPSINKNAELYEHGSIILKVISNIEFQSLRCSYQWDHRISYSLHLLWSSKLHKSKPNS
jgi:Ankyrin repeats (many copies)